MSRCRRGPDDGAATVLVLGLVGVMVTSVVVVGVLGRVVVARHRAEAAADLAALAAAGMVQQAGPAAPQACARAGQVARAGGARLARCQVSAGGDVTVITRVEPFGPAGAPRSISDVIGGLGRAPVVTGKARAGPAEVAATNLPTSW